MSRRDIRIAERLAELDICDDSLYEPLFASLGRPEFRPWQVPSPAKDLWKTLGGRPKLHTTRPTDHHLSPATSASDDWFFPCR